MEQIKIFRLDESSSIKKLEKTINSFLLSGIVYKVINVSITSYKSYLNTVIILYEPTTESFQIKKSNNDCCKFCGTKLINDYYGNNCPNKCNSINELNLKTGV